MCSASQTNSSSARRVAFSLGSNSGDRLRFLERACDALSALLGDLRLSQVYETEPMDCPAGSPRFLNACVEAFTAMPPEEILTHALRIETELGRCRSGIPGEERTCDIDLIYCSDLVLSTPALTLPHPRAHLRRFVLRPLCDIDPSVILPGQTLPISQLLTQLPEYPAVFPYNICPPLL